MYVCRKEVGTIHEMVGKNPLDGILAAKYFAEAKFLRGLPKPTYASLKSDETEQLDEPNRQHVTAVLTDRARKLGCSVSDLAWAVTRQTNNQGLRGVLVKKWEDIEREQFERRKAENG